MKNSLLLFYKNTFKLISLNLFSFSFLNKVINYLLNFNKKFHEIHKIHFKLLIIRIKVKKNFKLL